MAELPKTFRNMVFMSPNQFGPVYPGTMSFGGAGIAAAAAQAQAEQQQDPTVTGQKPEEKKEDVWDPLYARNFPQTSWMDIAQGRKQYLPGDSLRAPYGNLAPKREGGGRHPFEYMLKHGWDPGDPKTYGKIRDMMSSYRGPDNPGGDKASPFDPEYWVRPSGRIRHYMDNAPLSMRERYRTARFGNYDNGLRNPYGDNRSDPTGQNQNPAWDEVLQTGAR